ncbi:MAG: Ig-like domain-containing protein, partial [bacterium]
TFPNWGLGMRDVLRKPLEEGDRRILIMNYQLKNICKSLFWITMIFLSAFFFYSCANQLPPSGGENDTIPPKIISIFPRANTINFKGNKILIKFDEYVDRRSFEESFFISPKPKGEMNFNWSGREVEIEFSKSFDRDITYVVIIGRDLKDFRGGNPMASPVSFAFSTGNKIDMGKISGKVYSDNYDRVKILAYIKNGKSEDQLNPEKYLPDYLIQVSPDGSYEYTNLPNGDYRIFAITDEDRNNLFEKDFDKIGIFPADLKLTSDSNEINNINFLLNDFDLNKNGRDFLDQLKADSTGYIFSNITNGEKNIPTDYKFYFYFKNDTISKADIVNNFSLTDSATGKSYRLVFNWLNDSLAEVFSTENFEVSSKLKIVIDLTKTAEKIFYTIRFNTAGKNNTGTISGKIISNEQINFPVYIKLYNTENKFITYTQKIADTSDFKFEVLEGNYILLSFIDENDDGKMNKGNHFPFKPAEKFIIYETDIKVKGGWKVENVFLNY